MLLALMVSGCGLQLAQFSDASPWRERRIVDPYATPDFSPLAALRAHMADRPDRVWKSPSLVHTHDAAPPPAAPLLSAGTLLRVEIVAWNKISCGGEAARHGYSRAPTGDTSVPAELPTMDAESLPPPSRIRERAEIWIVPAEVADAHFGLGPAWLGSILRKAGLGQAVYFPSRQDCGALTEAVADWLPRKVFWRGTSGKDMLEISARSPFTARAVEACSIRVEERQELVTSYHIPAWTWGYSIGFRERRIQYQGRVVAKCASGERVFSLAPIPSGPLSGVTTTITESRPKP